MKQERDATGAPTVIYVDVDDTLVRSFGSKRIPMTAMVERVRELARQGAVLYCWSSGGAEYAEHSAAELGLTGCFRGFLPKPHVLIDDTVLRDWRLAEVHPTTCVSMNVEDLLHRKPCQATTGGNGEPG